MLAAAQASSEHAEHALERLCQAYWKPVATFLARKGYNQAEAEELTQAFFAARVVTRAVFKGISHEQGRFRSWLLACVQNFQRNEWERNSAQKRGGGSLHISLEAEGCDPPDLRSSSDAEAAFDRAFSLALLDRALEQLRIKYQVCGKGELFDELRKYLPGGEAPVSYEAAAGRLGKSVEALKMAVSRIRKEFGAGVRLEIYRTVSNGAEAEEELRYFLELWSG